MRNSLIRAGLTASFVVLALAPGCAKKGAGTGSRRSRPGFQQAGTILVNGAGNQTPPPPADKAPTPTEVSDPQALSILAACFNLAQAEVVPIVGWTDPVASLAMANAYCSILSATDYKQGILMTALPVDVSAN